jgi:hypothetical protein
MACAAKECLVPCFRRLAKRFGQALKGAPQLEDSVWYNLFVRQVGLTRGNYDAHRTWRRRGRCRRRRLCLRICLVDGPGQTSFRPHQSPVSLTILAWAPAMGRGFQPPGGEGQILTARLWLFAPGSLRPLRQVYP